MRVQVSHAGVWAREKCQLRVVLDVLPSGAEVVVRAALASRVAIDVLRHDAAARVLFTGQPGTTLSGVGMDVGAVEEVRDAEPDRDAERERAQRDAERMLPGRAMYVGELVIAP